MSARARARVMAITAKMVARSTEHLKLMLRTDAVAAALDEETATGVLVEWHRRGLIDADDGLLDPTPAPLGIAFNSSGGKG